MFQLRQCLSLTALLLCSTGLWAQSFSNLDFEAANPGVGPGPIPGLLSWAAAAPGWNHGGSGGSGGNGDIDFVYQDLPHVGISPWYALLDREASSSVLQGRYSLSFASGHASSLDPGSAWVPAYLSQTALIPLDTRSVQWLGTGPLQLFVNGQALTGVAASPNAWAADLSAYAGQIAELRFQNMALSPQIPVTLDGIAFSTAAVVPEPASVWLLLGGLAGLMGIQRRHRAGL